MKPTIIIRITESELKDVDFFVKSGFGRSRADFVRRGLQIYIENLRKRVRE